MSSSEPFRPVTNAGHEEIDAADPGFGAPGTDTTPDTDEDAQKHFDEQMEEQRRHASLFHTPDPAELHDQTDAPADE